MIGWQQTITMHAHDYKASVHFIPFITSHDQHLPEHHFA
jgi:hypothetical protein